MFIFPDGKDLNGIKRPQDITYMKFLRYCLRFIAAWPEQGMEGKYTKYHVFKKCYVFLIEFTCLPLGCLYLKNNLEKLTFFELGHTYITVFVNGIAVGRLVSIFHDKYFDTVCYFIKEFHLFNHKDESNYAMETHIRVHKMCHLITICLNAQMILGILMFNGMPLCNNISSGVFSTDRPTNVTYEQAIYYAFPFDYEHNFSGYLTLFLFNWYMSYICSSCICVFDLLLSLMVLHSWGHLKILVHTLENFPRPQMEAGPNKYIAVYSKEEMKNVNSLLNKCIIHHGLIKDFVTKMSDTFGATLFLYYCFQQVTGCLLLLECSQMTTAALIRYGLMTAVFFEQVIQLSIVFELLGSLSGRLSDAVYSIPWECMDSRNSKTLYVFLMQSQKSIIVKAVDMVALGVQTMAMVIKTSLSYFIMLKTLADLH